MWLLVSFWEKSDPTVSVVSTEQLNPENEAIVQRIVTAEGYTGTERDEMIRKVSAQIVGQVEALADGLSADSADRVHQVHLVGRQ
jgi:hypothetical protein